MRSTLGDEINLNDLLDRIPDSDFSLAKTSGFLKAM
jgi:hypothetical protein